MREFIVYYSLYTIHCCPKFLASHFQIPLEFGPKSECIPSFRSLNQHFTTSPEAPRCPPEAILRGKQYNLPASWDVIKHRPRDLKLGLHSDFGPISSLEFGE